MELNSQALRMADLDDIVLPWWMPDETSSKCCICETPFTFLTRRHHCRRCGRLVCATCSPHRITIPRQYIVRPPEERLWDEDANLTRSHSGNDSSEYLDNLGGGETVRVCNPCVPDPNYGPPPSQANAISPPPPSSRSRASTYAHDTRSAGAAEARDFARSSQVHDVGEELQQTQSRSVPFRFSSYGHVERPANQASRALQNMPQMQRTGASTSTQRTRSDDSVTPYRHRYSSTAPVVIGPSSPARPPTVERPTSRDTGRTNRSSEEDECPVCGTRQPPFGPGGAATDRERHVEECLSSHFAFSAGPSTGHASSPGVDPAEHPITSGTPTTPGILGVPSPSLRQRMLVYHATEKDCFDESGDQQECVICFEEFQPGDEMGRLECLCRFHRSCIRSWWSAKGPGSCPTHQLHG